jgi:hypothetical protein
LSTPFSPLTFTSVTQLVANVEIFVPID